MTVNKKLWSIAVLAALATSGAYATPIRLDGSEQNLQEIVDGLATDGSSNVDVVNEQYGNDQAWQVDSVFMPSGQIVAELAGYAGVNRLGLYDIYNPNARVQLFAGSDGTGATTLFNIAANGRVYRNFSDSGVSFATNLFGFYLETPDGVWFSQSILNQDKADHLVAYQGQGDVINTIYGPRSWTSETLLLGWEDLPSRAWDQDYNDFVLFVSGVSGVNVPEPMSMGLFGLGLIALGFSRRKNAKAAG